MPHNWTRSASAASAAGPILWAAEPAIDPEPIKGVGGGIPGALAHLHQMLGGGSGD